MIGYVASALVVVSLSMRSVVRLRIISLIGSVTFVAYGALIGSIPVIITNLAVAFINIWYLRHEFSEHRDLAAVRMQPDNAFLVDLLRARERDIKASQPKFAGLTDDSFVLLLTRDGLPAGVFAGRPQGSTLQVDLDYVTPPHRDDRLGTWLYGPGSKVLTQEGFDTLVAHPGTALHRNYLRTMGYQDEADGMVKRLR